MKIGHFTTLPIYKQQVLFISLHFHILDAPVLDNFIRNMPKYWDKNSDSDSDSDSDW